MSFLKDKMSWSNADFIPFKLCVASFYVVVGTYFHNFFQNYYVPLFILFGITLIGTLVLWTKKMRKRTSS